MKKHIPNFITLLNLFSGFTAIVFAANHNMGGSLIMMCCALLFDFCDGLVARLLHVKSELGKQLDSLSDLVSFGVAPALIFYQFCDVIGGLPRETGFSWHFLKTHGIFIIPFIICAIYVCAGALRLGKFNLDDRQTENFRGLPIPLAAFTIVSTAFLGLPYTLTYAIFLIVSMLMLTNITLFSLKFKNLKWKDNLHRYLFLLLGAAV
ncbi:MAG: CDP-alcohol phosphatidyltransferase family protein, partial [Bacteroidales bacterium]|nr:CDP-alcohol phosphatidyltransferase family protein [Bacteroidales bacterium]